MQAVTALDVEFNVLMSSILQVKHLNNTHHGDPRQLLFNIFSAVPGTEVACVLHAGVRLVHLL